jgi:hypothetical protein
MPIFYGMGGFFIAPRPILTARLQDGKSFIGTAARYLCNACTVTYRWGLRHQI